MRMAIFPSALFCPYNPPGILFLFLWQENVPESGGETTQGAWQKKRPLYFLGERGKGRSSWQKKRPLVFLERKWYNT